MAQMNGMELARKIRERNRRIQITFLTGLPDFISEGYEVDLSLIHIWCIWMGTKRAWRKNRLPMSPVMRRCPA